MPDIGIDAIPVAVVLMTVYAYAIAILGRRSRPPTDPAPTLTFIALVPCLNEGAVIARTVRVLLELRGELEVFVIDDDSDDESVAALAPFQAHPRFHLLQRKRPDARLGKGEALNAGLHAVRALIQSRGARTDTVIVSVFDSDGRVGADYLQHVAPYFSDPAIEGVQSAVRMDNASTNLLTRWQDMEFVIWGELFSRGKDLLGSATLGGNGQLVRLSALDRLGDRPWRPSLTEDLDLSLRLLISGGRVRYCPSAAVIQQAIPRLRPLLRQRARWMQGHLVAWQYLGAIFRSRLRRRAQVDLLVFLLLPALFVPIGVTAILSWMNFASAFGEWTAADVLVTYILGFPLAPLVAVAIGRRYSESWAAAARDAHLYFAYSAVWFVAGWLALIHVIRGRRGWVKTARVAETTALDTRPFKIGDAPATVAFVFGTPVDVLRLGPVALAMRRNGVTTAVSAARDPEIELLLRTMGLSADTQFPAVDPDANGSPQLAPLAGALESFLRQCVPNGCVVTGAGPWAASGLVAASLLDIPSAHLGAVKSGRSVDLVAEQRHLARALLNLPVLHIVEGADAARMLADAGVGQRHVVISASTMRDALPWLGASDGRQPKEVDAPLFVSLVSPHQDQAELAVRWLVALQAVRPNLRATIDFASARVPAALPSIVRDHPGIRIADPSPAGWYAELLQSRIVVSDSDEVMRLACELGRGFVKMPSGNGKPAREVFDGWLRRLDEELASLAATERNEVRDASRQIADEIIDAFGIGARGEASQWTAASVPTAAPQ